MTIINLMKMPSRRVENTARKGEIARYEQFLLFLLCFQKTCTADTQKHMLDQERDEIEQGQPGQWAVQVDGSINLLLLVHILCMSKDLPRSEINGL